MSRKATQPIPEAIREQFYLAAWDLAYTGYLYRAGYTIALCKNSRGLHTKRRHGLVVLWLTAIAGRFSELRRLKVADVSRADHSIFVKRSKRGLSGRVTVDPDLLTLTLKWRSLRAGTLTTEWLLPNQCGNQLDINAFNRDVCNRFGAMFDIPLSSHCFRDTACQDAMRQSQSIQATQRLLGHSSARTTDIYVAKLEGERIQLSLYSGSVSKPEGATNGC